VLQSFIEKCTDPLRVLGFVGQFVFAFRFVWQWIVSERRKESTIPLGFWWCSVVGGSMTLAYGILIQEPPVIMGQMFSNVIYVRNLVFIYHKRRETAAIAAATAAPTTTATSTATATPLDAS
jgi:lipid-A-disaccharide synthase-like uncharacterized protein